MHDHGNGVNRRQFLGTGLLAGMNAAAPALPVASLFEAIYCHLVNKAQAAVSKELEDTRNYINVMAAGAPCRYAFDHWMATGGEAIEANQMVATSLSESGGNYVQAIYKNDCVAANGLRVPDFFNHSVNLSSGTRPLKDLLNNMMVIRGYGTGSDGHLGNLILQTYPLSGAASLDGAVADNSGLPFSAVTFPPRGVVFASKRGKGISPVGGAQPMHTLMQAFSDLNNPKGRDLVKRHEQLISSFRSRLRTLAQQRTPASTALSADVDNAQKLMKSGLAELDAFWAPAVARYKAAIDGAVRGSIPGVTDKPSVFTRANVPNIKQFGVAIYYYAAASTTELYLPVEGTDLRTALATASLKYYWAEGLALTEFLIMKGWCKSIDLLLPQLDDLQLATQTYTDSIYTNLKGSHSGACAAYHDMHGSGALSMVMITTALFRGFAAGILELAGRLKQIKSGSTDAWQNTVVHLTSDFGRAARADGGGSDHGFNQMVTSVYSGAINGPICIGNIKKSGENPGYEGTQGIRAAIDGYNQPLPTPLMAASTVAEALRLRAGNPFKNLAEPLVKEVNGKIVGLAQGKVVG